jgi:hypothetical protein
MTKNIFYKDLLLREDCRLLLPLTKARSRSNFCYWILGWNGVWLAGWVVLIFIIRIVTASAVRGTAYINLCQNKTSYNHYDCFISNIYEISMTFNVCVPLKNVFKIKNFHVFSFFFANIYKTPCPYLLKEEARSLIGLKYIWNCLK